MPRNDQMTRQWFLLKLLERPRVAALEDLAQSLPEDYVRDALTVMQDGELIKAELRFGRKTSAWAKDRIWHPSEKATLNNDDCLTLKPQITDTPELAGWILSLGASMRVIKPQELCQRIGFTTNKIANQE